MAVCIAAVMIIACIPFSANAVSYSGSSSYMSGKYYTALTNVQLTGDQREDLVNVARSQVGYQEGSKSSQLSGEVMGKSNYTEYGRWYTSHLGTSYNHISSQWCAMFVSWCAYNAGIDSSIIKYAQYTENQVAPFRNQGRAYSWSTVLDGGYTPQAGDIVFFLSSSAAASGRTVNHVGIVTGWDGNTLYTIEGNTSSAYFDSDGGCCADKTYSRSSTYVEYICSPAYTSTDYIPSELRDVVFDHNYYSGYYSDLSAAFGTDESKLYSHFKQNGITEGRRGSPILDIAYYLQNNSDLAAAFDSHEDVFKHYIANGYKEVRYTAPSVDLGSEIYATIDYASAGLVLDVNGTNVVTASPAETESQVWRFVKNSDGTYTITNGASGLALDVTSGSIAAGTNVGVVASNDSNAQKWFIHEYIDGTYVLRAKCGATCVMDVAGGATAPGGNVIMYTYNSSTAQRFTITPVATPEEREFAPNDGFDVKENNGEMLITGFLPGDTTVDVSSALSDDCKVFDADGTEVKSGKLCTGYVIKKYVNGLFANKATVIVSGDITGDGTISAKDIIRAKKNAGGLVSDGYVDAIDIDGDGIVSSDDIASMAGMIK